MHSSSRLYSRRRALILGLLALSGGLLGACNQALVKVWPEPRPGTVTDTDAFARFLALEPDPETFQRVYPDVVLVLPGTIATQELRTDNSRFFAELGPAGQITGGGLR